MYERLVQARNKAREAAFNVVMPLSNNNLSLSVHIAYSASIEASNKFVEGQAVFEWWKGEYDRMGNVFFTEGFDGNYSLDAYMIITGYCTAYQTFIEEMEKDE